jgi:hypothetical protein
VTPRKRPTDTVIGGFLLDFQPPRQLYNVHGITRLPEPW